MLRILVLLLIISTLTTGYNMRRNAGEGSAWFDDEENDNSLIFFDSDYPQDMEFNVPGSGAFTEAQFDANNDHGSA